MPNSALTGELISFYSGFINTCESTNTFASLDRRRGLDNIEMNKNSLAIFDIYQPDKKFQNLCVFVPEEYSSTGHYRATLGEKTSLGFDYVKPFLDLIQL